MKKPIYPCLWFDQQANDAAAFYCSIFPNSKILDANPMAVVFEIRQTKFMALNGGSHHSHSPATSFVIECETQEEINYFWAKLGEDGRYNQCGWLVDKYGISWQIVPAILSSLLADPIKAPQVIQAFLKMQKFDIQTLINA